MRRALGFSLIELLVVIAIIAILAAIAFPVYARAKDAAFRGDDMASMNQLRTALQLYYTDQGAYPPQLLGYVTLYSTGPNAGNVIPAQDLNSYLFKKRVGALSAFKPSYNKASSVDTTGAVYPNADPRPLGTPVGDLNGDGVENAADDVAGTRQPFGPTSGFICWDGSAGCGAPPGDANAKWFYAISGYDVASVKDFSQPTQARTELRYTLFWTQYGLTTGSSLDDPRQLGYANPPDDTIVTWNSYFREYGLGDVPAHANRDIILFLGGSAKPADSKGVYDRSWRYEVNP